MGKSLISCLGLLSMWVWVLNVQAQLPEGFSIDQVSDNWFSVTGIQFDEEGHLWGWSKFGQVLLAKEDYTQPQVVLDISEEVTTYGDLGLMGFALHPNFSDNGHIYLLYMVDPHHFYHFGTSSYDPSKSETHQATIGRLTRYTVDLSTATWSVDPASRKVLMGAQGESPGQTFAMLFDSHGVGSLVFGADGSLLVSCGDGASYKGIDAGAYGEVTGSFREQALEAGIIRSDQDIGTFRSQYLHSPNGKVLRINPDTGAGYPSNPFFNPNDPYSTASRVWALGFRQPFRFALQPGTGDHDPAKGNPGVFMLGEVGWAYWEELNVIDQGGKNYGWPIYGGMNARWQFNRWASPTPNLRAASTSAGCDKEYYLFQDLLLEETQSPRPFFPDPCNPAEAIPSTVPHFTHQRPVISWSNQDHNPEEQGTHVPGFDSAGQAAIIRFGETANPVKGSTFTGVCSVGGTFYTGDNFPPEYQMVYFHADFSGWIRQFIFGPNQELLEVKPFADTTQNIVSMAVNPKDGALYYIRYGFYSSLYKISYGGNSKPIAKIKQTVQYGPSPLEVEFASHLSTDSDGDSLLIQWDFGDGTVSQQASPRHVFYAADDQPTAFRVKLTVADQQGGIDSVEEWVSLNNTPPSVRIIGQGDSLLYSRTHARLQEFRAEVVDAEHSQESLTYEWQSFLHHNTHYHPNPIQEEASYTLSTLPLGCEEETYYYRVSLTVTDGHGLQHSDEILIQPDCGPPPAVFQNFSSSPTPDGIQISWNTLEENRCEFFEIQYQTDSGTYEVLDQVPANQNSSQLLTYSFLHTSPRIGTNTYVIQAINSYGTVKESEPLPTLFYPVGTSHVIYPNPGEDVLQVQLWEHEGEATFRLFTPTGQVVHTKSWESRLLTPQPIDTQLLPLGVYVYQLIVGEKIYYGKWLKH